MPRSDFQCMKFQTCRFTTSTVPVEALLTQCQMPTGNLKGGRFVGIIYMQFCNYVLITIIKCKMVQINECLILITPDGAGVWWQRDQYDLYLITHLT